MQLSIIIPMYNGEEFIIKLLDSIYKQNTFNINFETLIIDDKSIDNSLDVVEHYVNSNHITNIKLVVQEFNAGTAGARNKGLEIAAGDWVQFLDSDDSLQDNYFELIQGHLNQAIDCYVYGYQLLYGDCIISHSPIGVADKRMVGYKNSVANKIYKRKLLEQFNTAYIFEDVIWLVELMKKNNLQCEYISDLFYLVNRTNVNSKMANVDQAEWYKMAKRCIELSKGADKLTKAFVLETFVGTLFANIYSRKNRIMIASQALINNITVFPFVARKGMRNKDIKKSKSRGLTVKR